MPMIRTLFSIQLIILSLLWAQQTAAQDPYAQRMTITTGLPSNAVYSILEDRKGYIWFTCDEGLFRYDGKTYLSFKAPNQTTYSGSGIAEDILGRIWYQNFDGDSYYVENNKLHYFPKKNKINFFPNRFTDQYVFDKSTNHLNVYDLQTTQLTASIPIISSRTFTSIVHKNEFYFIEKEVLYKITKKFKKERICSLPMKYGDFSQLLTNGQKLLLVKKSSPENGIWEITQHAYRKLTALPSKLNIQSSKCTDRLIFLQTTCGSLMYDFSGNKIGHYFSTLNVSDILIDRKNNYWFTSPNEGITLVPRFDVHQINLPGYAPLRLIADKNHLLISTKNEQLLRYDPEKRTTSIIYQGTNNSEVYYLYRCKLMNELLLVMSDGGTYSISEKGRVSKLFLALKQVTPIDSKYNAFVASGGIGFFVHKSKVNEPSDFNALVNQYPMKELGEYFFYHLKFNIRGKSVAFDSLQKTVYFATNVGLYSFQKGNVSEIKQEGKSVFLSSLFHWNNRIMGFSPNGKLIQIKGNTCKNSFFHPDLAKTTIKQVVSFKQTLLVRTLSSLMVFKLKNKRTEYIARFDLTNQECNDMKLVNTTVWMVTSNGLIEWNLDGALKKCTPGLFQIDQFLVNNRIFPTTTKGNFSYKQNNITINFSLLDFGSKTIHSISYRVNNQNWRKLDPNIRQINFSSLSADDYQVDFRGKVNGKTIPLQSLSFTIHPPFWKTTWFLVLSIIGILGVLILYFKRQLKIVRTRNNLINEKITLESNLNKSLLASIKSQMNPHFIFNALNTIQAYIYMNDKENATGYLSKFSKLTRSVLEMSEKDEVFLSEEVYALKLYLDLEKMRFQEGFEYAIITESIDPENIKIPSMLIQPYVENAIKHGLLHSTDKKRLTIDFKKEDSCLIVEIDDNGIGRKRAEELRLQRDKFHVSFSTKANEKRLKLLNQENTVVVSYIDKLDQNQQAIGTTVKLTIQLRKQL